MALPVLHLLQNHLPMKALWIFTLSFLFAVSANAQNDIQLSQQSFTRLFYNPAACGQNQSSVFNFLTRSQWSGINEAPVTMLVNYQHFFEKPKVAAGINLVNDKLGLENNYNIKAAYSYRMQTGQESFLSLGIGAGVLTKNVDFGRIVFEDAENVDYLALENKWKPDFDAGIEMNWRNLSSGFSVTHINNSAQSANLYTVPRHYYGYLRGLIPLNEQTILSPAYAVNSCVYRTQHEFNLSAFFGNSFYSGLSYRLNESFVVLTGVRFGQVFRLCYSFDMNAGPLNNTMSGGTHEILLQVFPGKKQAVNQPSPRFFD